MKVNSDAIYGTTASPFKKLAWGRATQKPGKLYLHVYDWPADGRLAVPIANEVKSARLLAAPRQRLAVASVDGRLVVTVPVTAPSPHASVVVLEFKGAPQVAE
jgi:alpha-L-fucosidase